MYLFQFCSDAPYGRFAPSAHSILLVDGVRAWIVMEMVPTMALVHAFANTPLASSPADTQPPGPAQLFLVGLFLIHYTNRGLISPLRTPSRSKSHIIVPILGGVFNIVNGTLLGTYLRSAPTLAFLADAFTRPRFWLGTAIWALGFTGNILHDEILLNIRRDAKAKGKAKAKSDDDVPDKRPKEHYGIPYGYLYTLVSYPNYFCEWVEWFGFALAAAPIPSVTSLDALVASIQPPWIFFVSGIFVLLPRAYRGHRWYLKKFPDYPKDRKAVVPYVL